MVAAPRLPEARHELRGSSQQTALTLCSSFTLLAHLNQVFRYLAHFFAQLRLSFHAARLLALPIKSFPPMAGEQYPGVVMFHRSSSPKSEAK